MRWADGFITADWGTTNRRAYRIDANGNCVDEFEDEQGILSVPQGGFGAAVAQIRERLGDMPLLLAGMVGSNRGWIEAPYVPCPAGIDDLAAALQWPEEGRTAIVPGVSYLGRGRADVMRGEEVQVLGAVEAGLVSPNGVVCHPGTHNKWIQLRGGKIQNFATAMTGELFSLLKQHSILSGLLQAPVEPNDAFKEGVRQSLERQMLPAQLFGVRAKVLLGQTKEEDAASLLSGLLIGADVHIGVSFPLAARIVILGRPELTRLYATGVNLAGREAIELDGEQAFLAGAKRIVELIDERS
jgi:2-dehydro-3-deoxygalactonokinase